MSRKTAFGCIAYAFFAVMAGTTVPTPLFPIYEQRFGFGSLMVTVRGTFAPAALGGFSAFACPEERRGEVNATFYVVLYMGLCVSIVGVGLLSEVTGLRTAGIVRACVMTGLASAAALSLLLRDRRPVA